MQNKEIADIFREIADILDVKGENHFRVRAYQRAAQNIESLTEELAVILEQGKLTAIAGIGKDLADKIQECLERGTCTYYEELKEETPGGLLEMLQIPGLGPKTVRLFYERLNIDTVETLEEAAKRNKLTSLEGVREKTQKNILNGIALIKKGRERTLLPLALEVAESFTKKLQAIDEVKKLEVAGSLRRRKETVKDIDILVASGKPKVVMDRFVTFLAVKEVIAHGTTKSSVLESTNNMQVDLRVVEDKAFGAASLYFTGSKAFNIKLRQLAVKRNLKINEYGMFKGSQRVAGKTEGEIFRYLKMQPIIPELREDRGEVEVSLQGKLPDVVTLNEVRGDLHVHSVYSDGTSTIEEVARAAAKLGYDYVALSDHSQSLKVANGLSIERVYKKKAEIARVGKKIKKPRILFGTEVDILSDGRLDYPDSLLKEFDVVVAAIHTGFKQSRHQLTKRIVRACRNRYVHIIAHPTGKLYGVREPYEIDFDEVLKACQGERVALELNCFPDRFDLDDVGCMRAKRHGVKVALGSDAHCADYLNVMGLGISVARRGWLEKSDILNCMDTKALLTWLKR